MHYPQKKKNSPQATLIQYGMMPNGPGNHNLANYGHV